VGAIGVAWGYHPPARLKAAGAGAIAAMALELPSAVDRMIEARADAARL
jgi:hypothetical protein